MHRPGFLKDDVNHKALVSDRTISNPSIVLVCVCVCVFLYTYPVEYNEIE